MNTAAIIATGVAVNASIQADNAQKAICRNMIKSYRDKPEVTVAEMRQYSMCVEKLYPKEVVGAELIFMKIVIALVLLSIPLGSWFFGRDDDGVAGYVVGAFVGPMTTSATIAIIFLVWKGICFVFGV